MNYGSAIQPFLNATSPRGAGAGLAAAAAGGINVLPGGVGFSGINMYGSSHHEKALSSTFFMHNERNKNNKTQDQELLDPQFVSGG